MGNKNKEKEVKTVTFLICEELPESQSYFLKVLQEEAYLSEIKSLLLNGNVHKSSTLVPLSPI